jgi:hypothetical protein
MSAIFVPSGHFLICKERKIEGGLVGRTRWMNYTVKKGIKLTCLIIGHSEFKWCSRALNNVGCIHVFIMHEYVIILVPGLLRSLTLQQFITHILNKY